MMSEPFLIVGSNTDVGKTLFCGLLSRRICERSGQVEYLKVVQTGAPRDDDAATVQAFAPAARVSRGVAFSEPLSPHRCEGALVEQASDFSLQTLVREWLERTGDREPQQLPRQDPPHHWRFVEGAGGVLSPLPSGSSFADVLRVFRMPVVLVGDYKLGGISQTLSAMESLHVRGFDVAAVVFFRGEHENAAYLQEKLEQAGSSTHVCELSFSPGNDQRLEPGAPLGELLRQSLDKCLDDLSVWIHRRESSLQTLSGRACEVLWWPFTQHANLTEAKVIDSALADTVAVSTERGLRSRFDASASWWTQGVGHGHTHSTLAISQALGRYGHVLFPGQAHEPAVRLAEELLRTVGAKWAKRVFFSDNGSTAVEVALKMAFRLAQRREVLESAVEPLVLGLRDSYHGDTIGAMSATSPNIFTNGDRWYRPQGVWLDFPRIVLKQGRWQRQSQKNPVGLAGSQELSVDQGWSELEFSSLQEALDVNFRWEHDKETVSCYENYIDQSIQSFRGCFGTLLLEPVMHGASGMLLVDPLFQHCLAKKCKELGIPVVYDEVFSGFFRLGVLSAREILGVDPDVSCFSKIMTGGSLPLATTLATEEVFKGFLGSGKESCLLHGHSFTAHPAGCAAALASLHTLQEGHQFLDDRLKGEPRCSWDSQSVQSLSQLPGVEHVVCLGTVVAVSLVSSETGYGSGAAQHLCGELAKEGLEVRPLGNVVYLAAQPVMTPERCAHWMSVFHKVLKEKLCS